MLIMLTLSNIPADTNSFYIIWASITVINTKL
jgi:hypothetical protein